MDEILYIYLIFLGYANGKFERSETFSSFKCLRQIAPSRRIGSGNVIATKLWVSIFSYKSRHYVSVNKTLSKIGKNENNVFEPNNVNLPFIKLIRRLTRIKLVICIFFLFCLFSTNTYRILILVCIQKNLN